MQMLAPIPMLAYLLREAEGMTIGPNILIMPLLNPVHVAEDAVTLDLLSGGRYVLGIGVGYREAEFDTFKVPLKERALRMDESIEIMRRLWTEDKVTYHGKVFKIDNLGIGLKPLRKGGPPIWVAGVIDVAVKRAARVGDAWLITNFAHLERARAADEDVSRDARRTPASRSRPRRRSRANATSGRRAPRRWRSARPRCSTSTAPTPRGVSTSSLTGSESFQQPFEDFVKDRFIIGDKAFVKEEIQRYNELLGVNHFLMRVQWPGPGAGQGLAHDQDAGRDLRVIRR